MENEKERQYFNIWVNGYFNENNDEIPKKYLDAVQEIRERENTEEYNCVLFTNVANYLAHKNKIDSAYGQDKNGKINVYILDDPNFIIPPLTTEQKKSLEECKYFNVLEIIEKLIKEKDPFILNKIDENKNNEKEILNQFQILLNYIKEDFYNVHPVILSDRLRLLLLFMYPVMVEKYEQIIYHTTTYMDHDLMTGNKKIIGNLKKGYNDNKGNFTIVKIEKTNDKEETKEVFINNGYLERNLISGYHSLIEILCNAQKKRDNIEISRLIYGLQTKENLLKLLNKYGNHDLFQIDKELEKSILFAYGPGIYISTTTQAAQVEDKCDAKWKEVVRNNRLIYDIPYLGKESNILIMIKSFCNLYNRNLTILNKCISNNSLWYKNANPNIQILDFLKELSNQLIINIELIPDTGFVMMDKKNKQEFEELKLKLNESLNKNNTSLENNKIINEIINEVSNDLTTIIKFIPKKSLYTIIEKYMLFIIADNLEQEIFLLVLEILKEYSKKDYFYKINEDFFFKTSENNEGILIKKINKEEYSKIDKNECIFKINENECIFKINENTYKASINNILNACQEMELAKSYKSFYLKNTSQTKEEQNISQTNEKQNISQTNEKQNISQTNEKQNISQTNEKQNTFKIKIEENFLFQILENLKKSSFKSNAPPTKSNNEEQKRE